MNCGLRAKGWKNSQSTASNIQWMIQHCSSSKDLAAGNALHKKIVDLGLDGDTIIGNLLVRMYALCGSLALAEECFTRIKKPNVFSQNILMVAYAQNGHLQNARCVFATMPKKNVVSWTTMLTAYSHYGQMEESIIIFGNMPGRNLVAWNAMVAGHTQGGHLDDGIRLFNSMPERDLASWTALTIASGSNAAFVDRIYSVIPARDVVCSTAAIAAHARAGNLAAARRVFDSMTEHSTVVCNAMMSAFTGSGDLVSLQQIFDAMPYRSIVSWNCAIQAHARDGHLDRARELFVSMPKRDSVSWTVIVSALPDSEFLEGAKNAVEESLEPSISLCNALVQALARGGFLDEAEALFSSMDGRDAVTWTAMIGGYAHAGNIDAAEATFVEMSHKDMVAWTAMLWGYAQNKHILASTRIFQKMPYWDAVAWNALITAYSECGELEESKRLFDEMPGRSPGSWSAIMLAFAHANRVDESKEIFDKLPSFPAAAWSCLTRASVNSGRTLEARALLDSMPQPDLASWTAVVSAAAHEWRAREIITDLCWRFDLEGAPIDDVVYAAIVEACASQGALAEGKLLHRALDAAACRSSKLIAVSLINMYGKCWSPDDAWHVFTTQELDCSSSNDTSVVVLWTSMISALALNGLSSAALKLFHRMMLQGIQPDVVTFTTVFDVCGVLQAGSEGRVLHSSIADAGLDERVTIACSLITMYSKWGCVDEAERAFQKVAVPNVVVWTALISAYARNGCGRLALLSFATMDVEGVRPDQVTFISVLDACGSVPDITRGKLIRYEIACANLDHSPQLLNAVLNLYSKCGCIDEARKIFERLPSVGVVSISAMLQAFAQNGHGQETLNFFRLMLLQGIHPENVTFLSVFSACSHAGLVNEGCDYFVSMKPDYEVVETVEHFTCMLDLFARSGKLEEAEDLIHTMPYEPEDLAWMSLLAGCRSYGHVERGARAASRVLELNSTKTSAPFVLLSRLAL